MENSFLIKKCFDKDIAHELKTIGFDEQYLSVAKNKYDFVTIKIFTLTPVQATILKQTALSCGADCAVNKGVLTHSIEQTDVILGATISQMQEITKKLSTQQFNLKNLAADIRTFISKDLKPISIRNKKFLWDKTYIMGILNCTPNSFSDGGEFFNENDALMHFQDMLNAGADVIDIGAESTAPHNYAISVQEEINRLQGILKICRNKNKDALISVDTRNSQTAAMALELGVDIINDVSGFVYDECMAEVVKNSDAHCVLTFCDNIADDTIDDTVKGLIKRVNNAINTGVKEDKIILDVGIGFNKTFEQNIELVKRAREICSIGFPVMYGISRKSFIQKITHLEPKQTLCANISLGTFLAEQGVNILRVHDVYEHKIALNAIDKVLYD